MTTLFSFRKNRWYFTFFIATIVVVGIFIVGYVFFYINSLEKKFLAQRSATIAGALDVSDVLALSGDESDLSNTHYLGIKEKLRKIVLVNPDIRFIYLTGKREGQIFFFVDSEDPNSEGYSPPGQIYYEASQAFLNSFENKKNFTEGPVKDRWGIWISSLTPIIDPQTQKVAAMVGIDVEAKRYINNIIIYSMVPFLGVIFLLIAALGVREISNKESELLDLKSEFVAIASHELRSPLTGLNWSLQLLSDDKSLTDDQRKRLQKIIESSHNLTDATNSVLDFFALERGGIKKIILEKCDLVQLLNNVIANLILSAEERNINIKFDNNWPREIIFHCDKDRMRRAFSNLISNAIKYSYLGREVILGYKKNRDAHIISIKDQGIGIPKKDQSRVFKGFYRAQNAKTVSASGTGLGLYYVKSILEMHKVRIWFESEEGKGTTFFIAFPFIQVN